MDDGDEPTLWEAMDYQMRTIHTAVGNLNHPSPIIIVGTNGESLSEDSTERVSHCYKHSITQHCPATVCVGMASARETIC